MTSLFLSGFANWGIFRYVAIFVGMSIEGDATLFTSGFLAERAYVNFPIAMAVAFLGTVCGDMLWFYMGKKVKNRDGFIMRRVERLSKPLDNQLKNYPFSTLIISKYSIGIHRAVIFRFASIGNSFKDFLAKNCLASFLWIIGVGSLGYLSGASFDLIKKYLQFSEISLLIGLIVFIGISSWIGYQNKTKGQ